MSPSEADWKNFRQLRELALERFCKRTLDELQPILDNASRTYHDRYLEVFRVLNARDDVLAAEPGELDRFSESTRSTIDRFIQREGS